jgi:hypothetical protein
VRFKRTALFVVCLVGIVLFAAPSAARAQDFGVLESAETINRGNFKLRLNPMWIVGDNGEDDRLGAAILAGYGFTDRFDLEGGVALYDGVTFLGVNAECWLIKHSPIDVSIAGGLHFRTGDQTVDLTGIDLTFLASGHVTPSVELYGGIDVAFEAVREPGSFRTVHFVPGVEVRITDSLDFVAEAGLALNDSARHYFAGGLAFYVR